MPVLSQAGRAIAAIIEPDQVPERRLTLRSRARDEGGALRRRGQATKVDSNAG